MITGVHKAGSGNDQVQVGTWTDGTYPGEYVEQNRDNLPLIFLYIFPGVGKVGPEGTGSAGIWVVQVSSESDPLRSRALT